MKWEVGLKFASMEEFKQAVRDYGIKERRALHFITNDSRRCQVGCEQGCRFYLWASRLENNEGVQLKTVLDDHLCTKPYHNKIVSVKYLTELYGDRIRKNPQWKVKEMIETIREDLEIEVPRIKCSRVRKAALEGVFETLKEHYSRVWDFGFEILKHNPKNRVDIRTNRVTDDDVNKFQRIYICYNALKEGWKLGCRPVLGLDGCFLKTVCGGQLLSAVGRDANNNMFPVAYAVVENAMKEYLPSAEHRLCTRHLYNNLRKRFISGPVKKMFWIAVCATHPAAHQRAMKALQRLSKPAYEQLQKLNPRCWSKAYFQTHCFADNVENNMSECFNSWIINERFMPLLNMLMDIHFKLMRRIRMNREAMQAMDIRICPRIKQKLDLAVKASRKWNATWDGMHSYMVRQGTRSVTVDLEKMTCDCRAWNLTGIPCAHAVAAIHDKRQQPVSYVSHFYTKEIYLKAYSMSLPALRGEEFWETSSVAHMLPPECPKKLRGRPKRLRRREAWEGGSGSKSQVHTTIPGLQKMTSGKKMHCSHCRKAGHKKPKCPDLQPREADKVVSNEGDKNTSNEVSKKQNPIRPKLPIRRQVLPGVVIKEPSAMTFQVFKGKEKISFKPPTGREERPFWMTNQKVKTNVTKQGELFMPTPVFVRADYEPQGTPRADTPPVVHSQASVQNDQVTSFG